MEKPENPLKESGAEAEAEKLTSRQTITLAI